MFPSKIMIVLLCVAFHRQVPITAALGQNARRVDKMRYPRFSTESLMFPQSIASDSMDQVQRQLGVNGGGCSVIESSSIFGNFFGQSCTCSQLSTDAPFDANCPNFCKICNKHLGICVSSSWTVTYNMPSTTEENMTSYSDSPSYLHQIGSLQYSGNRNDVLTYQALMDIDTSIVLSCSVAINGVNCTECRANTTRNTNCSSLRFYNCSNIESGLIVDQCLGDENRLPSTSPLMALNKNYFNFVECLIPPSDGVADIDNGNTDKSGSTSIWLGWKKYASPVFFMLYLSSRCAY